MIGEMIPEMLSMHDVEWVDCGSKALQRISAEFDVILCDNKMPDSTGRQIYEHLKEHHPGLERRILFITGEGTGGEPQDFVESIRDRVLLKPFKAKDLISAIELQVKKNTNRADE